MKKNILPIGSVIKIIFSFTFFIFSMIDLFVWKTIILFCTTIIMSIFFLLYSIKIIKIRDNYIFASSDLLLGWHKVQYKTTINLEEVILVEEKSRDYTYSSRGQEKNGRGIETRIIGNRFIEFTCADNTIKRIHCNDLSKKQIKYILDYCKNKTIETIQ